MQHRRVVAAKSSGTFDAVLAPSAACTTGVATSSFPVSPQLIRRILRARRARQRFMNGDLFADPAWDILLELFALRLEQRRISITSLCRVTGAPATTGLRWIAKLEAEELIERVADPSDRRRSFVELSRDGERAMRSYMDSLPSGIFSSCVMVDRS